MAKYCGKIGFASLVNDEVPGVTQEVIHERMYYGEIIRNTKRYQAGESIIDDVTLSNQISVLMDPYLQDNFYNIRYLTLKGVKWKVTSMEMRYPRMIFDIGGVYNEQSDEDPSEAMCHSPMRRDW